MKAILALFLALAQGFVMAQPEQTKWKLKKEVDDLQVFVRKSETSDIKEIKVRYVAEASLSTIVAALKDIAAFPDWIYNCAEAKVLERISDTETIYYSRITFPFPMSDRDFIARSKIWQHAVSKEVFMKTVGDYNYLPQQKGLVRLPKLQINWHITPLSPGKAMIDYHLVSDPGGAIPDWAVNMAIDKGPVNSIKNFKAMLTQSKYRQAQLHYIQEMPPAKTVRQTDEK